LFIQLYLIYSHAFAYTISPFSFPRSRPKKISIISTNFGFFFVCSFFCFRKRYISDSFFALYIHPSGFMPARVHGVGSGLFCFSRFFTLLVSFLPSAWGFFFCVLFGTSTEKRGHYFTSFFLFSLLYYHLLKEKKPTATTILPTSSILLYNWRVGFALHFLEVSFSIILVIFLLSSSFGGSPCCIMPAIFPIYHRIFFIIFASFFSLFVFYLAARNDRRIRKRCSDILQQLERVFFHTQTTNHMFSFPTVVSFRRDVFIREGFYYNIIFLYILFSSSFCFVCVTL